MSRLKHNGFRLLNPSFNLAYELLQSKDVKIHKGENITKNLAKVVKDLGCKKPLFVTDKIIVQLNLLENAVKSLDSNNIDYVIYDGVKPDPTTDVVDEAVKVFIKNNCDGVISFGGGSSIDAAKVISGLAKNPRVKKYAGITHMMPFCRRKGTYPLISIPTTAGTGAEVTMGAVISDSKTHKKGLVMEKEFCAKHVFLDPNLLTGLPPHVTAATGFDALAHAFEAYVSKYATKKSKVNSINAIKDLFKYLPVCYEDGANIVARSKVLIASNEAGFAIGRAHIGTVHSIAHNAGAIYGIPHGLIVGVVLPHVLELYFDKCKKDFAQIAVEIGFASQSDATDVAARKLIDAVWKLLDTVGMPSKLDKVTKDKFAEITDKAIKESYLYPIPRYVTKDEVLSILNKISN